MWHIKQFTERLVGYSTLEQMHNQPCTLSAGCALPMPGSSMRSDKLSMVVGSFREDREDRQDNNFYFTENKENNGKFIYIAIKFLGYLANYTKF